MPSPEWCKHLEQFFQLGETFKTVTLIYLYALFTATRQHIPCQENNNVYDVIKASGVGYTVELCKSLYVSCSIPYKEQHSIIVC